MKTFISTTDISTRPLHFWQVKKVKGQTKKSGLAGHIFCLFRALNLDSRVWDKFAFLFLSKTKPELQCHLLVKTATKRIERCFCPVSGSHHGKSSQNIPRDNANQPPVDLKAIYMEHTPIKRSTVTCYHCHKVKHKQNNYPDRTPKPPLSKKPPQKVLKSVAS